MVDANEGWTVDQYQAIAPELVELGVAMIEQPLPAGADAGLSEIERPVPLCAGLAMTARASKRVNSVDIKIDKTDALALKAEAEAVRFRIMIGCMLGTSLAMAPATSRRGGRRS